MPQLSKRCLTINPVSLLSEIFTAFLGQYMKLYFSIWQLCVVIAGVCCCRNVTWLWICLPLKQYSTVDL